MARVQSIGDGVQLPFGVGHQQVRAMCPVPAQHPVGVSIGPALLQMRISKGDVDRKALGQPFVRGHLVAPIIGQGVAQRDGYVPELLGEPAIGTRRIRALYFRQQDLSGHPFNQRADDRPVASEFELVVFPVALHRSGGLPGGPFGDRPHVGNLATAVGPPCASSTRLACLTQGPQQFGPQCAARQHLSEQHRWFLQTATSSYRQNKCGETVRKSARASSPDAGEFGRTATARDREVSVGARMAGATGRWRMFPAGRIGAASRRVAGNLGTHRGGRSI